MPTPKTIAVFTLALLICTAAYAADIPNSETLQRLQAAYSYETNSFERYRAFAEKADADGYPGLATLFRATSRAAQIHYTSCIDAIRELGYAPQGTVETPIVDSTRENLQAAIKKTEAFDRDKLYPTYIKRATAEGNQRAAKTFDSMLQAEAQNLSLFKAALKNLDPMRAASKGYYVCAATGYVTATIDPAHCMGSDWELEK
ncbi:MAG TPA: rubrerythrin family protein [Bryobacteraceae bacterium]|nr:rubrerythrin family protein [Bryobacteraceae bacterium]